MNRVVQLRLYINIFRLMTLRGPRLPERIKRIGFGASQELKKT